MRKGNKMKKSDNLSTMLSDEIDGLKRKIRENKKKLEKILSPEAKALYDSINEDENRLSVLIECSYFDVGMRLGQRSAEIENGE